MHELAILARVGRTHTLFELALKQIVENDGVLPPLCQGEKVQVEHLVGASTEVPHPGPGTSTENLVHAVADAAIVGTRTVFVVHLVGVPPDLGLGILGVPGSDLMSGEDGSRHV